MAKHILIADDEMSILAVLKLFFERVGYRVTGAPNGQEALNRALIDPPDLIILDIQMPIKTGVEAVIEMRAHPILAKIPVIALTAHVRDYLPPDLLSSGFDRIITKPFELLDLQHEVQQLLAQRGNG